MVLWCVSKRRLRRHFLSSDTRRTVALSIFIITSDLSNWLQIDSKGGILHHVTLYLSIWLHTDNVGWSLTSVLIVNWGTCNVNNVQLLRDSFGRFVDRRCHDFPFCSFMSMSKWLKAFDVRLPGDHSDMLQRQLRGKWTLIGYTYWERPVERIDNSSHGDCWELLEICLSTFATLSRQGLDRINENLLFCVVFNLNKVSSRVTNMFWDFRLHTLG